MQNFFPIKRFLEDRNTKLQLSKVVKGPGSLLLQNTFNKDVTKYEIRPRRRLNPPWKSVKGLLLSYAQVVVIDRDNSFLTCARAFRNLLHWSFKRLESNGRSSHF